VVFVLSWRNRGESLSLRQLTSPYAFLYLSDFSSSAVKSLACIVNRDSGSFVSEMTCQFADRGNNCEKMVLLLARAVLRLSEQLPHAPRIAITGIGL
jgi:hypothetical protein